MDREMQIAGNDFCTASTLESAQGAAEAGETQPHHTDGKADSAQPLSSALAANIQNYRP